jgi:molybdenum cofactor cytidylyltransferase
MIWAIVLAAGESRRMGRPKLLLPYGETTIIETIVSNVVSSRVDGTVVVLGGDRPGIEEKLRRFAVKKVVNRAYKDGMLSSVWRGLAALPSSARAALFVLADQPDISSAVIDALIDAYRGGKKGIVLPVYKKKRGHPLLLDLKYRREIEALSPDIGLRGLLQEHGEDILDVRISSPAVLSDIDRPEDYERARRAIRRTRRTAPPGFNNRPV